MAGVEPLIASVIFKDCLTTVGWSDTGPTIPNALRKDSSGLLICPGSSRAIGRWFYIVEQSRDCLKLWDSFHVVDAVISDGKDEETASRCFSKGFAFQLLDFDVAIDPFNSDKELHFFLRIRSFDYRGAEGHIPPNPMSIASQINVTRFIDQLRSWLMLGMPTSDSRLLHTSLDQLPPSPSCQENFQASRSDPDMAAQNDAVESSVGEKDRDGNGRSMPQTHSISHKFPSEMQRWDSIKSLGYLPKYGSNPSTTSKAQVRLLETREAWDPPPTGQRCPQRYIPSGDLERLINLRDKPETFTVDTPLSTVNNSATLKGDSREFSQYDHSPDDNIAYAQRNRRQVTPLATASVVSQWSPSPTQHRMKPVAKEASPSPESERADVEEEAADIHEYENEAESPEGGDDLPPDTDEETHDETLVNSLTKLYNRSPEAAQGEAIMAQPLPESASERQQFNEQVEMSARIAEFPEQQNLDSSVHSQPDLANDIEMATLPNNETPSESESDSEIEMASPQKYMGVSQITQTEAKRTPQKASIQVDQTPYSKFRRDHNIQIAQNSERPSIQRAITRMYDETAVHSNERLPEIGNRREGVLQEKSTRKRLATPASTSPRQPNLDPKSSPSQQLREVAIEPRAASSSIIPVKRKVLSSRNTSPSDRSNKIYKIRDTSPVFSQDMLKYAQITPTVDELRRQHFQKISDTKSHPVSSSSVALEGPAVDITMVEDISSSESEHDSESKSLKHGLMAHESRANGWTSHQDSMYHDSYAQLPSSRAVKKNRILLPGEMPHAHKGVRTDSDNIYDSASTEAVQSRKYSLKETSTDQDTQNEVEKMSDAAQRKSHDHQHSVPEKRLDEKMQVPRTRPQEHVAGHNTAQVLPRSDIFLKFKRAYKTYSGDEKQFLAMCKKMHNPKEGFSLMKAFFDDFAARYADEYIPYCMGQIAEGETPQCYEEYFEENVDSAKYKGRVLNKSNVEEYIVSLNLEPSRDAMKNGILSSSRPMTQDKSVTPPPSSNHSIRRANRSLSSRKAPGPRLSGTFLQNRQDALSSSAQQSSPPQGSEFVDLTQQLSSSESTESSSPPATSNKRIRTLPWAISPNATSSSISELPQVLAPRRSLPLAAISATRVVSLPNAAAAAATTSTTSVTTTTATTAATNKRGSLTAHPIRRKAGNTKTDRVSKQEARARAEDARKPMRAALRGWKPPDELDEYTPMRVLARDAASVLPSGNNAFAREAGVKVAKRIDKKVGDINLENFKYWTKKH